MTAVVWLEVAGWLGAWFGASLVAALLLGRLMRRHGPE